MGTVYKVKYKPLNKVMAVKVLKPEFASDKSAIKRFEQEGKAASKLTHPNMVTVYQYGLNKGSCPYILMDYLHGPSLESVITNEAYVDAHRALLIFIQMAESLHHAHQKGIIHRDIKPSNVILLQNQDLDDYVKIVDFGIAKILPVGDRKTLLQTQTGEIFGSPQYMSPEQCRGDKLDARSDIYSLGCLMYETLCGKPPFVADNPIRIILQHLNDKPVRLTDRFPSLEIPADLDSLVITCLEKQPDNRYQSMGALFTDLTRISEGKSITFRSKLSARNVKDLKALDVLPDAGSEARNTRIYAAITAACVVVAMVGASAFMFFGPRVESGTTWKQLYVKGQQAFDQGDYATAKSTFEKSLTVAESEGDNQQKKNLMQTASCQELIDLATFSGKAADLQTLNTQMIRLQAAAKAQDNEQDRRVMTMRDDLKRALGTDGALPSLSKQGKANVDDHTLGLCQGANDELAWCLEQHKADAAIGLATSLSTLLNSLPTSQPELAQRCALNFGSALLEKERYSQAATQLTAAIRVAQSNRLPLNLGLCHLQLGRAFIGLRAFDKAKIELSNASQLADGESEKKAFLAACYYEQGLIFASKGDSDLAEKEFLLALSIFQKLEPPNQGSIADCSFQLAMLEEKIGRGELAHQYLRACLDASESLVERSSHQSAVLTETLEKQGEIQVAQEHFAAAKPLFARAVTIASRTGNEKNPIIEIARLYLVLLDDSRKPNFAELQELTDDICHNYARQPTFLNASDVVSNLVIMGRLCAQSKQYKNAEHLLRSAYALATVPANGVAPIEMSDAIVQLNYVLNAQGRRYDAIELQRLHMNQLRVKFSYSGHNPPPLKWLKNSLEQIASGDRTAIFSQSDSGYSGGGGSDEFTQADYDSLK